MKADCCCEGVPHLDVENLDRKHSWCLVLDDQSAKRSTKMLAFYLCGFYVRSYASGQQHFTCCSCCGATIHCEMRVNNVDA